MNTKDFKKFIQQELKVPKQGQKDNAQTKRMSEFLEQAFCLDGHCEFKGTGVIDVDTTLVTSMIFELNDSVRGKFYVSIGKNIE